jgi:hypothetical protein
MRRFTPSVALAAVTTFCGGPAQSADWWTLTRSTAYDFDKPEVLPVLDTCGRPRTTFDSPATDYESAVKDKYGDPEIVDNGDEVDVYFDWIDGRRMKDRYFHTEEACRRAAQANIDAKNEKLHKLDKYR